MNSSTSGNPPHGLNKVNANTSPTGSMWIRWFTGVVLPEKVSLYRQALTL